uniref:Uncharacterized protein n=1 Tax=Anguilla anguilla TaxID=7936 RepID=A0A0E9VWG6_ANGAN
MVHNRLCWGEVLQLKHMHYSPSLTVATDQEAANHSTVVYLSVSADPLRNLKIIRLQAT